MVSSISKPDVTLQIIGAQDLSDVANQKILMIGQQTAAMVTSRGVALDAPDTVVRWGFVWYGDDHIFIVARVQGGHQISSLQSG